MSATLANKPALHEKKMLQVCNL